MEKLAQHIEALVFATDSPMTKNDILECLAETFETEFATEDIEQAIGQVKERYAHDDFAIELVQISGGLQFMTKGAYHNVIATWLKQTTKKRLSGAAIETLSIIAYKQPVTKSECESIRGVSCDYSLQKLLEKELVSIIGRSERPGRPLLYGTSPKFMDYFGLKDLSDLPKPKDFKEPDSEVGELPLEEMPEGHPAAVKLSQMPPSEDFAEGEIPADEESPEEVGEVMETEEVAGEQTTEQDGGAMNSTEPEMPPSADFAEGEIPADEDGPEEVGEVQGENLPEANENHAPQTRDEEE